MQGGGGFEVVLTAGDVWEWEIFITYVSIEASAGLHILVNCLCFAHLWFISLFCLFIFWQIRIMRNMTIYIKYAGYPQPPKVPATAPSSLPT